MMRPEEGGAKKDLVLYRIQTARDDLKAARILLEAGKRQNVRFLWKSGWILSKGEVDFNGETGDTTDFFTFSQNDTWK